MINFDVIVYESEYYNNPGMVVMQSDVETTPLKSRFSGYSKLLETNVIDRKSGMKKNLQDKVRSIKFVAPVVNSDATPGVVIPASYGV
ncbi:unnamed protein product [Peronospora belbahrii]|nr:unnamed protein product [Peronospora belbahrii]